MNGGWTQEYICLTGFNWDGVYHISGTWMDTLCRIYEGTGAVLAITHFVCT